MPFNKKIYTSLVFFSIVILAFVFLIIYPLLADIKKDSQDFILQKNSFAELQVRKENFNQLGDFYQSHQEELKKIDNLFIDWETPIEFIEFLEEKAKDSSLVVEISSASAKKSESEKWNFSNYQLFLKGSFPNILKFLEKMETAPYLIEISNLNIKKLSKEESKFKDSLNLEGNSRADLIIKVYTK